MIIWIVSERDYDHQWIVAVYPSEELAEAHVALMGGIIDREEIRSALHPDATSPAKQQERAAAAEANRRQQAAYEHYMQQNEQLAEAAQPTPPQMGLCHCETFSKSPMWTAHGYCRYCGGWSPDVFRQHMGEAALQSAIHELAAHSREKMRQIISWPRQP